MIDVRLSNLNVINFRYITELTNENFISITLDLSKTVISSSLLWNIKSTESLFDLSINSLEIILFYRSFCHCSEFQFVLSYLFKTD